MASFRLKITFTAESESDLKAGYDNVLGGIEYRVDSADIIFPASTEDPSTMDYLCMALRSLLRAVDDVLNGDTGVVTFYEFQAYLAVVPVEDGDVRLGMDRGCSAAAIEAAASGPQISQANFIEEALAAGDHYVNWIEQADVDFRSRSCSTELVELLSTVRSKRS